MTITHLTALLAGALAATLPAAAGAQHEVDAQRHTAITEAVARVAPAVVTVQTEILDKSTNPFDIFAGRGERVVPGIGSGIIVRKDGVIVTNAHVVQDAQSIAVALRDGTTYPAQLVGKDEINDLAVLRIDATDLPVAPLGNSDDLIIGEWAIAIGNPYGFMLGNSEPSVTAGVISGTGRNLIARSEGAAIYVDMIQTDAAINPGNSGGPLVNALGEVIGVNSSIFTPSGGSIGLGFAIPINRVKRVTEDLLAHGVVRRPWVGLKLEIPRGDRQFAARWTARRHGGELGGARIARRQGRHPEGRHPREIAQPRDPHRLRLGGRAARSARGRAARAHGEARRQALGAERGGHRSPRGERAEGGGAQGTRTGHAHAADPRRERVAESRRAR